MVVAASSVDATSALDELADASAIGERIGDEDVRRASGAVRGSRCGRVGEDGLSGWAVRGDARRCRGTRREGSSGRRGCSR